MLRLDCTAQNYAWGRTTAENSEVANLVQAAGREADDSKPYAELWMGTHPSGLSRVARNTALSLRDWIGQFPERALGKAVVARFGADLPFLFKVLSVATALSIQSHPDKALAEQLHAERPEVYKDDNHKPEMTVALSDFEALCGFVTTAELAEVVAQYPELHSCLASGPSDANAHPLTDGLQGEKGRLKQQFTALMTSDPSKVKAAISKLQSRLQSEAQKRKLTPKEQLVLRLNEQYPGDVGVLAAFFLNYLSLNAGQAVYLPANVPHAYISGQLVECMATSDNVIRAGLTPKLRDTGVLCESLTYEQGLPVILRGNQVQEYTTVYSPPFDEFEIYRVALPAQAETLVPSSQGPTIMLVQEGQGSAMCQSDVSDQHLEFSPALDKGSVFFIPAQTSLSIASKEPGLTLWIAAVHSQVFAEQFKLANGTGKQQQQTALAQSV